METGARLAAYLSGDLEADERAALEAELARDPALRQRLERIRAADRTLADLGEVELPAGAEERLHEAVDAELATVLGDELATRRARRTLPRWVPAAAAAALVVVVGAGVVLSGTLGGSDDMGTVERGAPEAALDGAGDTEEAAGSGTAADTAGEGAPVGPRVVDTGRTLERATLARLAADPAVLEALGETPVEDPAATAAAYAQALGVDPDAYLPPDDPTADSAPRETENADTDGAVVTPPVVREGDVDETDLAAVAQCLPVLQEGASAPVVPLYAELGNDGDGTEVIALAALAPDDDGDYQRVEVWSVDRASCSLLQFVQHDR